MGSTMSLTPSIWSARTTDGSSAEVDDIVVVREIRGVKLIVEHQAPDGEAESDKREA